MILVPKFNYSKLERIDSETEGRKYISPDGKKLPSVTAILSVTKSEESKEALKKWQDWHGEKESTRITNESANVGTFVHSHLEKFIKGEERPGGNNILRVKAKQLADIVIEKGLCNVSEIWGTEISLYYPDLYAGTTDAIGVHNNEVAILDFKNTRKPKKREYIDDYFCQLVAYSSAHDVIYGTKIRKGVILMICRGDTNPKDFGTYQEFILEGNEFDKYSDIWAKRVEKFYKFNS